jgi:hypothetical protein
LGAVTLVSYIEKHQGAGQSPRLPQFLDFHRDQQMSKSLLLTFLLCLTTLGARADNEEFVYKIMRSSLDTQLQNEGFDPAAIDLVQLVGWDAANVKMCATNPMSQGVIESSAKEARIPINILIEKARAYMDLEVDYRRQISSDLQYCRRFEELLQKSK